MKYAHISHKRSLGFYIIKERTEHFVDIYFSFCLIGRKKFKLAIFWVKKPILAIFCQNFDF